LTILLGVFLFFTSTTVRNWKFFS